MKKILGLDLGTNSIGWAVVNANDDGQPQGILAAGSRIIPMDAALMGDFAKGNSISQTAERTKARMTRRLYERANLRRERLNRVLGILNFLPDHYAQGLNRYGQIVKGMEPKIAWKQNESGKFEFLFKDSFNEMLDDFKQSQPEMTKVPYDWTIYYLRKKALTRKITKEELSWLLHNFNQKRGYNQLRGEDEENEKKQSVEFYQLKVVNVEATDQKKKDETWYNVHLENGMIYRRSSKQPLDWVGKVKDFIVTTDLNDDGTPQKNAYGEIKRSFRAPKDDDWKLVKVKTESDIDSSKKYIGAYIYDSLLLDPSQKIRGKLVRTVERKYYKKELIAILAKQVELQPGLFTESLYKECIESLYPNNESHRNNISKPDFVKLFVDDILFYQRPLKSKKSLISDCPYERFKGSDGKEYSIKCIAKSNPLFQEFRLWQFISNLRIINRDSDADETENFLTGEESVVKLFDWLNDRKEIKQDVLLNSFFKMKKNGKDGFPYRWNYVEEKTYPCNETRGDILTRLKKAGIEENVATPEFVTALWHILYSVNDKAEIEKALGKFAAKRNLPETFIESFKRSKPYEKEYGAYSEKAIKKLLSLMRLGRYWSEESIDKNTRDRIEKIITGEYDEKIQNRVRDAAIDLKCVEQFKGLPVWLACYVVYDRHSEIRDVCKWENPEDIDLYLKAFKQHSLRNPIVEQVVTETLRVVRDIWKQQGQFAEIHIELGREMKKTAEQRKADSDRILENENTNARIKALLAEFADPAYGIDGVRPYSPSQQEILRIYEEGALQTLEKNDVDFDFVSRLKKSPTISRSDVTRYKCWLEQKYRSPYTGEMISLSRLFTEDYEIEHVIPQSIYFDDSFSNKVICESAVNKLKSNMLGYEFIKKYHGEKVAVGNGKFVTVFGEDDYERFVKENYKTNRSKHDKLLLTEIPEKFIERQMNDTRYISKLVKGLLSNVVREEGEQEAISKNVIVCNGAVTTRLKKDWGLNDVWNSIILPRFERMAKLTGRDFVAMNSEGHLIPHMPLELSKGFSFKRIDHRHHALDAITIACCSRSMVQYLNNESAGSDNKELKYALAHKLCNFEEKVFKIKTQNSDGVWVDGEIVKKSVPTTLLKPWETIAQDTKSVLENIIVSFKQNLRVINKASNKYEKYVDGKKEMVEQKGVNWAIRKPMHKETVYGKINLQKIETVDIKNAIKCVDKIRNKGFEKLKLKIKELLAEGKKQKQILEYFESEKDLWKNIDFKKIEICSYSDDKGVKYFASRKTIDTSFDKETIVKSVADTGIQKILLKHLSQNGDNPERAFSPDGIDKMNQNIFALNDGKFHQPIRKVRVYEQAEKFSIGEIGNKGDKYVEAAKGTNLFFAVYDNSTKDKDGNVVPARVFETIPLNVVIERQKNGLSPVPEENEDGKKLLFHLSPNDLVYLPTRDELKNGFDIALIDKNRVYKMKSCEKNRSAYIHSFVADVILDKVEYQSHNKVEMSIEDNISIKQICVPLKIDRLGRIIKMRTI